MKKIIALMSLAIISSSCVTKKVNSDGSLENMTVDDVKLSDTYVNLALEYQKHNAPQIALERVNLAIETNSSNARAYMVRGIIYASLNKPVDAEVNFKKAISLQKNFSDAYVNYGAFLCANGRYKDADANFDIALDNPLYYTPEIGYYDKGECYLKQKNYTQANQAFLKSLTYKSQPPSSYLSLARMQYEQNNYLLAKFYIDKFNGEQSSSSLWLHIQIIQAILDNNLAPQNAKENTSYRNTIALVLLDNYSDSPEAQKCIEKYGRSINNNNLITHPARLPNTGDAPTHSTSPGFTMIRPQSTPSVPTPQPSTNPVMPNNPAPVVTAKVKPVVQSSAPSVSAAPTSMSAKSDAAVANVKVQADGSGRKYIIVPPGTTMYAISRKFGITIQQIEKFNNMKVTQISKGMKLYIE